MDWQKCSGIKRSYLEYESEINSEANNFKLLSSYS